MIQATSKCRWGLVALARVSCEAGSRRQVSPLPRSAQSSPCGIGLAPMESVDCWPLASNSKIQILGGMPTTVAVLGDVIGVRQPSPGPCMWRFRSARPDASKSEFETDQESKEFRRGKRIRWFPFLHQSGWIWSDNVPEVRTCFLRVRSGNLDQTFHPFIRWFSMTVSVWSGETQPSVIAVASSLWTTLG